jgi:adenine-specific DNA methylase
LHKGSQNIIESDIANDSVQLIITDPPYLGQVAYSEYMQLYKPFLGLEFNLKDEIVVSSAPSRNKDEDNYFELLDKVFEICSAKLKESAFFCMYFHDCNLDVWDRLIRILSTHHLRYLSQAHIAKSNTLKNIISPKKSLNGDCILFFTKDSGTTYRQGAETVEEVEKNIIKQAKSLVRNYKSLSTPELYDHGLMEVLIQNGWLTTLASKHKSLIEIFEKHLKWDSETSKWTL